MEPPFLSWQDSRRLPGPSLLWDRPSAVLETALAPGFEARAVDLWRRQAQRMQAAVGWAGEDTLARRFAGGASLAVSAPIDALYSATLVNEWAADAAEAILEGAAEPDLEPAAGAIRAEIAAERNPALVALAAEAARRGVAFVHGDDQVSVGLGKGSLAWPERELPAPDMVAWASVHDVPVALVTGTNGKSTTVRMLAAMAAAAGHTVGLSTSDWIKVAGEVVEEGDFSGPTGARLVLRDRRVDLAVLEVARGGLLRRGLPLARADVAVVTNIAADHLGEYGIHDVDALAEAKLVVAKAVARSGRLVLNADDRHLRGYLSASTRPPVWFGIRNAPAAGAEAALVEGNELVLIENGRRTPVLAIDRFPAAFGGAASHNLANGLAALAAGRVLGLAPAAMAAGLARFGTAPADNPGRAVRREVGGVEVLVDFAHNPHGIDAIAPLVRSLPARRRLLILGQGGDRSNEDIRALARAGWRLDPDLVLVKEMDHYLRGRAPGEVPAIIALELRRLGAGEGAVRLAGSEIEAARAAFAWAEPGDLLILLCHEARAAVMALIDDLVESSWRPGHPLPAIREPDA
jgi:UDP-N-acetylmuramyl tripeptide synthase